jgi:hypothetical protein
MPHPFHPSWSVHPYNILHPSPTSFFLIPIYSLSTILRHSLTLRWETKFHTYTKLTVQQVLFEKLISNLLVIKRTTFMELLGSLPCSVEHAIRVGWMHSTSLHSLSLRLILILFSHPHLCIPHFVTKCFYTFSNSAVHATCPGHLKKNSVVLVRKRSIPTERPPHVGEVSANFCG